MKLTDYISDRIVSIVCFVIAEGLLFGLLWLIEVPSVFIAFAETIFLLFFLAPFIWDFHRRSNYYNRLLRLLEQLDEKTLLMEIAERPTFLDAQIISDILRQKDVYKRQHFQPGRHCFPHSESPWDARTGERNGGPGIFL